MRVLFVSADSYYDRDASVFNSTKSAENLVLLITVWHRKYVKQEER